MDIVVRHLKKSERTWAASLLRDRWGSEAIVSRGKLLQADRLPALLAEHKGERLGLLTYTIVSEACEIVSLDSLVEGQGVASALLQALENEANKAGCKRLWLVTTNDNTHAIDFYRRRGFTLRAIHHGAMESSRKLKPEIPLQNESGVAIEDEWEFERFLSKLNFSGIG